jgi:hypothetical protein
MTKPKTPLIALQGGLVLSALRKKKKMSDDPFAWYPFAAESAPMMSTDDAERKTTPAQNNDEDNQSVSGDSVADHDPQPRIVLPPGLTLDKKSRSSASVVSLGSWEPLDLMDLEPADSGESEEGSEGSSSVNEEDSASKTAAKTLASDDDASSSLGSRRVTVSYFASHVSVVIVMLSLTFLGTKRSPVKGTSLMSIRGAAKPSATTSLAILAIEPTEDMDAKAKVSSFLRLQITILLNVARLFLIALTV